MTPLRSARSARRSVVGRVVLPLAIAAVSPLVASFSPRMVEPASAAAPELDVAGLEAKVEAAVELAAAATVGIQVGQNLGSGVLVSARGHILTAGHVIESPGRRTKITLADGRVARGRTLGVNRWVDSGMVLLDDPGPWPHVEMGSVDDVASGDWVIALGHPGGVEEERPPVVRLGRVSSVDARVIRTDCTIVSGDSGGPLIDLAGKVVGIHTSLRPMLVANDHLPVDTFRRTWLELERGEAWGGWRARAILGVEGRTVDEGCLVVAVLGGGSAAIAGLQAGDVLARLDGAPLSGGFPELEQLVSERKVGDRIALGVLRDGTPLEVVAELQRYPGQDDQVRIVPTPRSAIAREKNDRELLASFRDLTRRAQESTVQIRCGGRQVALGTVVDENGWIVTKASELDGTPTCRIDGRIREARVVGVDKAYDLALLHVDKGGLRAAPFSYGELTPGQWVVTPDSASVPASVGVLSVPPRRVPTRLGYLGVIIDTNRSGAYIVEVRPDSGAAAGGLRKDDVLLSVNGAVVEGSGQVTELVRALRPLSEIEVGLWRDLDRDGLRDADELFAASITLGEHPFEEQQAVAQQDRQAGPMSAVRSGFPIAFQHDSVLLPEQCGGPVVDKDGRVIGVNLARAGRSASFAIPSRELMLLVDALKERASD
jgi:serine protease Do